MAPTLPGGAVSADERQNPPVGKHEEPPREGKILATRREAFARLFGFAGVSGIGAQVAGCGSEPPGPAPARLPLSALPPAGRLRVLHRGDPVELRREGEEIRARSLLCTHQGCEVRWRPDLERYRCPCHQGMFDAEGRPFSGPPMRPLAEIPVRVEAGEIVVGETPTT